MQVGKDKWVRTNRRIPRRERLPLCVNEEYSLDFPTEPAVTLELMPGQPESQNSALTSGISGLGQIAINVHDPSRATAFYRDVLGLPFLFSAGELSFFNCGGVRLMLTRPEKPEFDHPSSVLYFKVADIAAAYDRMAKAGVHFEDKPHVIARMADHDLWMTFFRDTEQNLLGLMSEVPRPK